MWAHIVKTASSLLSEDETHFCQHDLSFDRRIKKVKSAGRTRKNSKEGRKAQETEAWYWTSHLPPGEEEEVLQQADVADTIFKLTVREENAAKLIFDYIFYETLTEMPPASHRAPAFQRGTVWRTGQTGWNSRTPVLRGDECSTAHEASRRASVGADEWGGEAVKWVTPTWRFWVMRWKRWRCARVDNWDRAAPASLDFLFSDSSRTAGILKSKASYLCLYFIFCPVAEKLHT